MIFRAWVPELFLSQIFCHAYTDRHFPEIVKSCSGILKCVNSSKTGNRKFARNQYFLLYKKTKVLESCKFSLPFFDGFKRFGMPWTRYDYFWKISVCVWQKFYGKCNSRTNSQNFIKFYISCYPKINWCLSAFGKNHATGGALVSHFPE